MRTAICKAKDPANCRYHGTSFTEAYAKLDVQYKTTGALPKVLFEARTVTPKIDNAEVLEYEGFHEMGTQSFGFAPFVGEDADLTAYVEIPYFESQAEEKAAVAKLRDEETDPVKKARYDSILQAVSRKDADEYLQAKENDGKKIWDEIMRSSEYETTVAEAHTIHTYGKAVDAQTDLNQAEKAIVLWESLKKHEGHGVIALGEFGDVSYKKVAADTWEIYALMAEREENK